jgi:hypothetical protein
MLFLFRMEKFIGQYPLINAYKAAGVVTIHGYFKANVCVH